MRLSTCFVDVVQHGVLRTYAVARAHGAYMVTVVVSPEGRVLSGGLDALRPEAAETAERCLAADLATQLDREASGQRAPRGALRSFSPLFRIPWADVPPCERCGMPEVTRAEHKRAADLPPGHRLACISCGASREGSDAEVSQAESARRAWETKAAEEEEPG